MAVEASDLEMLRRCRVFDPLDDAEVSAIAELAERITVPSGETVFRTGDPGEHLYVIIGGAVQILRGDHVTVRMETGEFVGEMAMFNQSKRVATVQAIEDTELLALPDRELQRMLLAHDQAAVKLVQELGRLTLERMQEADEMLAERLNRDDPALASAFDEYRQVRKELLGAWALAYHAVGQPGKLAMTSTKPSANAADLSVAYSPGVAEPCLAIRDDPESAYMYTTKGNLVGVISNGTAVLGLGSIGALASKPVMEGKAVLLKRFANVDAIDIEVDTTDPDEFVDTVVRIAPTFGGINLEDIAAPECFWIEEECKRRIDIPVMHDDQHGTAIIVGAALLNAMSLVGKDIADVSVVFSGAGAAGFATARYLLSLGVSGDHLIMTDIDGVIYKGRDGPDYLAGVAADTPLRTLSEAISGADVFVGVSAGGVLTPEMLKSMAPDPIVFALANPHPEIDPDLARRTRSDVIMATGRSDHPNQVNNVLAFPYLFRGALDTRATAIDEGMKQAATRAIAALARATLTEATGFDGTGLAFGRDYLIPKPFDRRLLPEVATAVARAAMDGGAARKVVDIAAYRLDMERISAL